MKSAQTFPAISYLNYYYSEVDSENAALLGWLHDAFKGLPAGGRLLDFGCGPTVYALISASERVGEIHLCDPAPENLAEIERWRGGGGFNWDPFIAHVLRLEGRRDGEHELTARKQAVSEKITRMAPCDAFAVPSEDTFDIVMSNFCAESITTDHATWVSALAGIFCRLRPGGHGIITAIESARSYNVEGVALPATPVTQEDVREAMIRLGFTAESIAISRFRASTPRGYAGLIMATGRTREAL